MGMCPFELVRKRSLTYMFSSVYVHQPHSHCPLGDPVELRVAPPHVQHSVGAIVWGQGASADALFASSESQSTTDYTGYHAVFDADQGRRVYEFNAKESGDAMALDPDGSAFLAFNMTFRNQLTMFPQVRDWPYAPPLVTAHIY
jgi:hypothetical protein